MEHLATVSLSFALMNPIYWLFARIHNGFYTLMPNAVVEQLPVATIFILNIFLVAPITEGLLIIEALTNMYFGTIGTVIVWLLISAFNYYWLLDKKKVALILRDYPVKPTSKGYAKTFFGAMVLFTLFISLFSIARLIK
jgi:hypothetical protein